MATKRIRHKKAAKSEIAGENTNIATVDIDILIDSEYNPRVLTADQERQIKQSLTRFGLVDPLVVNSAENRKNVVIGGHQRLKVLKQLGYKQVKVCYFWFKMPH